MTIQKTAVVIIGQIIHCVEPYVLQVIENGFVEVSEKGEIVAIGELSDNSNVSDKDVIKLKKSQILIPGLIDTHIHGPQYPNVGLGYDKPLLEWLDHYTYKLEKRYHDAELSEKVFDAVVRKTLDCGTTTASYFGSLFTDSTLILVDSVIKHGQRALVGKVNMTRLAPDDYVETPEKSIANTLKFIEEVKNRKSKLVEATITPRFAPSCDMEHMMILGDIAQKYDLNIQTHISENLDELELIQNLFNDSYANVYHSANLLTPKTILAHGIHLSDPELELIKKSGTSISHCPESNSNLLSGLCDVVRLKNSGITVGLGTDLAGGASPSIITAMRRALTVSAHISLVKDNYTPLNYEDVFYLATLGGAKALAMGHKIGNFEIGKSFDAVIADLDVDNSSADYLQDCASPRHLLQKLIFLGDDRNVVRVFVNGRSVK